MSRADRGHLRAAAIVLVALNLRAAVSSVGPVLPDIRSDLHLPGVAVAALASLPVFCFGACAAAGPALSRRLGLSAAIGWFTALLLSGLVLRIGPGAPALFAGTLLAATGIAAGNVLIPALVKAEHHDHAGLMMGFYTLAVTGSAAAGSGLSVPVAHALGGGWRMALGIWALPAGLAVAAWVVVGRGARRLVPNPAPSRPATPAALRTDRVAWAVTAYFGLQSLSFYAALTWLPTLFEQHGFSAARAGTLLSISGIVQAPVALGLPPLVVRMRRQWTFVLVSAALTAASLLAILVAPTSLPYAWVVALGIGQGMAFPLALMFIIERSRTAAATQRLSAMAQGVGYLLAGTGPLMVGVVHSWTDSWVAPLLLLIGLLVPQSLAGVAAARRRFAGAPTDTATVDTAAPM